MNEMCDGWCVRRWQQTQALKFDSPSTVEDDDKRPTQTPRTRLICNVLVITLQLCGLNGLQLREDWIVEQRRAENHRGRLISSWLRVEE